MPPRAAYGQARPAAERAVALDPDLAEAHYAVGMVRMYCDWDLAAGEAAYRTAIARNPSLAVAHTNLAVLLAVRGQVEEAIAEAARAQTLDPVSVVVAFQVAIAWDLARRDDEATGAARRALDINPGFGPAWGVLSESLGRTGQHPEAVEAAERYLAVAHRAPRALAYSAMALFGAGRRMEGDACLEELRSGATTHYVSPFLFASALVARGDYDDALTWLERACDERVPSMVFLNVMRPWDPLRSDPRFQALVTRIGLPSVPLA